VPSASTIMSTNCSGLFVVQTRTLSLIVQSYQPREMNSGLLNADGYLALVPPQRDTDPFTYKIYSPSGMTLTFLAWGVYVESGWDMSVVLRRVRLWI